MGGADFPVGNVPTRRRPGSVRLGAAGNLPRVSVSDADGPTDEVSGTAVLRPRRVEPVSVSTLLARADARLVTEPATGSAGVTGVTLRAQEVLQGDLFAALPGRRVHGAEFATDALAGGAAAILTDEAGATLLPSSGCDVPVLVHEDPRTVLGSLAAWVYGEPSLQLAVLGVTGTSGKTTTAYLVEAGLRAAGLRTGLIGTIETRVTGQRIPSAFTTPEAPDLQAMLAAMVEQGVTHVVMEVSSHALALGRVNGTRFAVGAFTNLSQEHLDFHRDMADYFAAKALLFDGRATTEVVVVDTEWGRKLVGANTVTVTGDAEGSAAWWASDRTMTATGEQSFVAHGPGGLAERVELPLPGAFNVTNALLAAAMLGAVGVAGDVLATGLAAAVVPGRMERVDAGQSFTAVVDYAHKPAAVGVVLESLRQRSRGNVITVLGCGGDRDTAKRPVMGEVAARGSDLLIVTDDNPRSEDPAAIRAAVVAGAGGVSASEAAETLEIGDRREAIREAVRCARPGDVVLVAGKGHEAGQERDGVVHPFSDRTELRSAVAFLEAT